jgi:hypothetical protein
VTRARDIADQQDNLGGAVPPVVAGKNRFINGDFSIWQRGTSFTNPANFASGYTADRFFTANDASGATRVISRQTFSNATSGLPVGLNNGSPQYFFRYDQQVVGTGGSYNLMEQRIEGIPFPNQIVTLSFWAKASSALVLPQIDREITYNGSNSSAQIAANVSIGTSWARYSFAFTMPAITGTGAAGDYFGPRIWFPSNSTFTFDVWGWQLEAGSVATPFTTASGTIGGELALCQRYYYRQTSVSAYGWMAYGGCQNTVNGQVGLVLPVQMRVVPTALEYANVRITDSSYAGTLTTLALNVGESTPNVADLYVTASGITGGRPLYLGANNNAAAYVAVTAEL